MVRAPANKFCAFTIPARQQSDNAQHSPKVSGFFSLTLAPYLECSSSFELSTKAVFAKAAFDTLREQAYKRLEQANVGYFSHMIR